MTNMRPATKEEAIFGSLIFALPHFSSSIKKPPNARHHPPRSPSKEFNSRRVRCRVHAIVRCVFAGRKPLRLDFQLYRPLTVYHGGDGHGFALDPVDDAIAVSEHLADTFFPELRHHPPRPREDGQPPRARHDLLRHRLRVSDGIFRDVRGNRPHVIDGPRRPDYFSHSPSRSSAASWVIAPCRSAASSPWRTFSITYR